MALQRRLLVCAGLILFASFARAQTGSTEITGVVTDTTGAIVSGAKVKITANTTMRSTKTAKGLSMARFHQSLR